MAEKYIKLEDACSLILELSGGFEWLEIGTELLIEKLKEIPAADVVEVVRCRDCEYFETDAVRTVEGVPLIVAHNICRMWAGGCMTEPNGYCSFETRRKHELTD